MTCIVAIEDAGTVYMGSDRAASNWSSIISLEGSKTVTNGPLLLGFCGSMRMGQLLQHALDVPSHRLTWDVDRWVTVDLMTSLRATFEAHAWHEVNSGVASGGHFLMAVGGRCYEIQSDYSFNRNTTGEYAAGSGAEYALGSLHATRGEVASLRVMLALEAAAEHSPTVAGPFDIVTQEA